MSVFLSKISPSKDAYSLLIRKKHRREELGKERREGGEIIDNRIMA